MVSNRCSSKLKIFPETIYAGNMVCLINLHLRDYNPSSNHHLNCFVLQIKFRFENILLPCFDLIVIAKCGCLKNKYYEI